MRTAQEPRSRAKRASVSLPPGARCVVCNGYAVHHHHVVKQQRIDAIVKPESLAQRAKEDPRGVIPLCNDCHTKVEAEAIHLQPHELPKGFTQYLTDYGLVPALPRHLTTEESLT